jgi:hypothetical protein
MTELIKRGIVEKQLKLWHILIIATGQLIGAVIWLTAFTTRTEARIAAHGEALVEMRNDVKRIDSEGSTFLKVSSIGTQSAQQLILDRIGKLESKIDRLIENRKTP